MIISYRGFPNSIDRLIFHLARYVISRARVQIEKAASAEYDLIVGPADLQHHHSWGKPPGDDDVCSKRQPV